MIDGYRWMLGSAFFTSEGVIDIVTNALYGTAEERKLACAELEDGSTEVAGYLTVSWLKFWLVQRTSL